MEENKAHVEIYDDDSVVELFDENDKSVEFREIASIELEIGRASCRERV